MDEVEMADPMCAFRCGSRVTEDTSTKEHVVPNAIGGRKRVTGFICNSCNNQTGAVWDAELARQLNPLGLLWEYAANGANCLRRYSPPVVVGKFGCSPMVRELLRNPHMK